MAFTTEDLDTAVATILGYLERKDFPARAPARAANGTEFRTVVRVETPRGMVFRIGELKRRGEDQPAIVQLTFLGLPREVGSRPVKGEARLARKEGIFKLDREDARRRYEQELQGKAIFHLLRPGAKSPTSPYEAEGQTKRCSSCRLTFIPWQADQRYCCQGCPSRPIGRDPKRGHTDDCTLAALPWSKRRRLRRMIAEPKVKKPLQQWRSLLAGEKDKDSLFLQLAIYAARDGLLSQEATHEAYRRFEDKFRKAVGRLAPVMYKEGTRAQLEHLVLERAWSRLTKAYMLPGIEDGFSRCARNTIALVKRNLFSGKYPSREVSWDNEGESADYNEEEAADVSTAHPHRQAPSASAADTELSLKAAADLLDISLRRLYDLIAKGVVPARQAGDTTVLQPGGEEAVKKWQTKIATRRHRAAMNKVFAVAWAMKKRTSPQHFNSAKTQVKRWRAAGLEDEEIRDQRIGQEWIKKAIKNLGQFLTGKEIEAIHAALAE